MLVVITGTKQGYHSPYFCLIPKSFIHSGKLSSQIWCRWYSDSYSGQLDKPGGAEWRLNLKCRLSLLQRSATLTITWCITEYKPSLSVSSSLPLWPPTECLTASNNISKGIQSALTFMEDNRLSKHLSLGGYRVLIALSSCGPEVRDEGLVPRGGQFVHCGGECRNSAFPSSSFNAEVLWVRHLTPDCSPDTFTFWLLVHLQTG